MKKVIKIVGICVFVLILLDFIPVKFAVKNVESKTVFISKPKLGDAEWGEIEYDGNEFNYGSMIGYVIDGETPDKILNEKYFDKTDLHVMYGDNTNKFLIDYDEKKLINDSKSFPVYKIDARSWEILYPIHRTSLRRLYAPKNYLTIYDFDWFEIVKKLF